MLEVPGPVADVVASNGYLVVLGAGETQFPASASSWRQFVVDENSITIDTRRHVLLLPGKVATTQAVRMMALSGQKL